MTESNWGPSYGDPTHPTTGELPRVGDGRGTDELRTVQVDTVAEAPPERAARHRYSWESSPPSATDRADPSGAWSVPNVGREGSVPSFTGPQPRVGREGSVPSLTGPQPRVGRDDTTQFARVGNGQRGSVGPVTVQVDHVRVGGGTAIGDTQLLSTAAFMRPAPEEIPEAVESPQPEPGIGSMPAMRHQIGPDWTQTPLRLLAAAAVATAVLGISAASLISIGNWINP